MFLNVINRDIFGLMYFVCVLVFEKKDFESVFYVDGVLVLLYFFKMIKVLFFRIFLGYWRIIFFYFFCYNYVNFWVNEL